LTVDLVDKPKKSTKNMRSKIDRIAAHAEESEKAIERYLCARVAAVGGMCLKYANAAMAGFPDRIVLLPGGRSAWVELKSRGARPRKLQLVRMEQLAHLGFTVHVADSKESVDAILAAL
jgi:hypothetical protein